MTRWRVGWALAFFALPTAASGQGCALLDALDGRWSVAVSNRSLSYGRSSLLQFSRAGRWIFAGVATGQIDLPEFAEKVPQTEGFVGAAVPLGPRWRLCTRADRFVWEGPTDLFLRGDSYESRGWSWSAGLHTTLRVSDGTRVVPSATIGQRQGRTAVTYSGGGGRSAAFTMTTVDLGLSWVLEDLGLFWVSVEVPNGLQDGSTLAPIGRRNGERAIAFGFGLHRGGRGQR